MPRNPRYIALASELRRAIAAGELSVGDQLPTEFALCETHAVSRHTARAALQVLEDARLIERRPGLGTRVIAKEEHTAFVQPLGGLSELLQYAREARLRIVTTRRHDLSAAEAKHLGATVRKGWLRIDGVRRGADGKALAATSIYVSAEIDAKMEDFRTTRSAVTEIIERRHGVAVAEINQTIRAELLSPDDAKALGEEEGTPSLRTVRRYFDASRRLFVISDTRHPGGRFAYEMTYRREGRGR
jgi:DNA-binding GntR family transcriptional regulator